MRDTGLVVLGALSREDVLEKFDLLHASIH